MFDKRYVMPFFICGVAVVGGLSWWFTQTLTGFIVMLFLFVAGLLVIGIVRGW